MNGCSFVFYPCNEEERLRVMGEINKLFEDVQVTYTYAGNLHQKQVLVKIKHILMQDEIQEIAKHVTIRVYCFEDFCNQIDCFNPTNEVVGGSLFPLHDVYGEFIHPVLTLCAYHADSKDLTGLRTLEVVDLYRDYRDPTWEKIGVWRNSYHKNRWYSQKVGQEQEGDHEVGYFPCLYASPRLGPFETKEAALEAAKEYE